MELARVHPCLYGNALDIEDENEEMAPNVETIHLENEKLGLRLYMVLFKYYEVMR